MQGHMAIQIYFPMQGLTCSVLNHFVEGQWLDSPTNAQPMLADSCSVVLIAILCIYHSRMVFVF